MCWGRGELLRGQGHEPHIPWSELVTHQQLEVHSHLPPRLWGLTMEQRQLSCRVYHIKWHTYMYIIAEMTLPTSLQKLRVMRNVMTWVRTPSGKPVCWEQLRCVDIGRWQLPSNLLTRADLARKVRHFMLRSAWDLLKYVEIDNVGSLRLASAEICSRRLKLKTDPVAISTLVTSAEIVHICWNRKILSYCIHSLLPTTGFAEVLRISMILATEKNWSCWRAIGCGLRPLVRFERREKVVQLT